MKKFLIFFTLFVILVFLYGHYIEVNFLTTHKYTIKDNDIPNSFKELKIVQFSDVLYTKEKNSQKLFEKAIKKINAENADIIIFNGDLFDKDIKYNENDYNYLKKELKKLEASLYKYAVIGDNDQKFIEKYKDILYEADFTLLDNESTLLFYKDETPINIIGLSDTSNISELMQKDVAYKYSLAIIHKPLNIDKITEQNIHTIFCGHTLGGIIELPYIGGLIKKDKDSIYTNGYYKVNNSNLYISNGLGYEKFNFRLFNVPSINVYQFAN